jgi:hypothetical protein
VLQVRGSNFVWARDAVSYSAGSARTSWATAAETCADQVGKIPIHAPRMGRLLDRLAEQARSGFNPRPRAGDDRRRSRWSLGRSGGDPTWWTIPRVGCFVSIPPPRRGRRGAGLSLCGLSRFRSPPPRRGRLGWWAEYCGVLCAFLMKPCSRIISPCVMQKITRAIRPREMLLRTSQIPWPKGRQTGIPTGQSNSISLMSAPMIRRW